MLVDFKIEKAVEACPYSQECRWRNTIECLYCLLGDVDFNPRLYFKPAVDGEEKWEEKDKKG
jgi:hypothetical protein